MYININMTICVCVHIYTIHLVRTHTAEQVHILLNPHRHKRASVSTSCKIPRVCLYMSYTNARVHTHVIIHNSGETVQGWRARATS